MNDKEVQEALIVIAAIETIKNYCDGRHCQECVIRGICSSTDWGNVPCGWSTGAEENALTEMMKGE